MEINKEQYLSRFKIYKEDNLFEVDYSLLKEGRCLICMNKLKITRDGKHAYCRSPKHKKSFFISSEKVR